MKDSNKTREQLLKELAELQKRVAATEKINKDLLESEAKYRNITENAALGIIVYNETGQCIATNKAMAEMVGATTVEQLLSQNFNKIESWKKSGLLDAAKEALASGGKRKKSFYILTTFGKDIWLDATFVTYIEKGGKFLLFLAEDITERKKSEEALRDSEGKYRGLFNAVFEGILIHEEGKIIEINPVFAEMFGYSPSELIGMNAFNTIAPESLETVKDKIKSGFEGFYEAIGLRKDGSKFDIEIQAEEIIYKGRKVRVGTVRDISDRKKAEKDLQDAHELLEERVMKRTLELNESNAALKMILKQRERDQTDFENNIISNVKHLIVPYIEKLKKHKLQQDELAYLNLIESNLKEIVSPFTTRLSFQFLDFTPREIMIADLIKDGKHDKDIMEILNIALDTVKTHRKNIRRKLGIYGNRINLRTKLMTLTK
jgi:PAS domain S-box-containing protein